jgi:hypothetical protein
MHKHRFWRPTKGRSAAFQDYLRQQSPERQREILAGEQRFLYAVSNPIGTRVAAAVDFAQGLRGPTYQFPVSELLDRVR